MKRALERGTFMFIGALIASIAYFVGNADRGAEAQRFQPEDKVFDEIYCRSLSIRDDQQTGSIRLYVVNGVPVLTMWSKNAKEGGRIELLANDERAGISMKTQSDSDDAGILLVTDSEEGSALILDRKPVVPVIK